MYQLVSAVVKPLGGNSRWTGMDIGNVTMRELFNTYKRVVATVTNSFIEGQFSLDLEKMRANFGGSALTFDEFLTANGNKTLPTSTDLVYINTRFANYSDAIRSGYKITPTHPTISPTSELSIADKPDAILTKPGADYELMYKHCLINVNGFYHQTDWSSDGLYVTDAMTSVELCGRNEVGIFSFLNLGELSFLPITDEMIYSHRDDTKLKTNCYVDTGVDLSQKTVMLVLGGYLHVLDKRSVFRISASAFGLDFNEIPLLERFYESHGVIDLSSLELETTNRNPDQVGLSDLYSDSVIRKYLQLKQTFFVVLDNADIFVDTAAVDRSPFPLNYVSFVEPVYPLVIGRGRHETYWPMKEDDRYNLSVTTSWEGFYNFKTVVTMEQNSVSNAQLPSRGYNNSGSHFLMIGSDV